MKANIRRCVAIVLGGVAVLSGLILITIEVRASCYDEWSCSIFTTTGTCEERCASAPLLCTWKTEGVSQQPVVHPVAEGYEEPVPSDEPPYMGVCYYQIGCNLSEEPCTWPTGDPAEEFFCETGDVIGNHQTVTFMDYLEECS